MKFKFCGDNDCQDWILVQIGVFSKLTSIKLKLILKEAINHILTGELNYSKACQLTSDAKLSEEDTKSILAALTYIISSSVKYNTDSEILNNELQQLGLPREHSLVLSKSYSENFQKLKETIKDKSLKFHKLEEYSYEIVSSLDDETIQVKCPSLIMNMKVQNHHPGNTEQVAFHVAPEKLNCLINDLKEAAHLMESYETSNNEGH